LKNLVDTRLQHAVALLPESMAPLSGRGARVEVRRTV
jgi:hypothetical protein